MSEIASLLERDSAHARVAREWMDRLDPSLYRALDEAARIYTFMSNVFVNSVDARELEHTILRVSLDLKISWPELMARIARGDPEPSVARASEHLAALTRIRAPAVVFLLLWRHFRWAATDICRFRLTAALGYQRQQAEALALFFVLRDDPDLAERWIAVDSHHDGKRLYRDTQDAVRHTMRRHGLYDAYENGSATALHVRFAGASRGLRLIFSGVPTLVDAEMDPDDLYDYHSTVLGFLQTQERIFRALDPINSERHFELQSVTRAAFEEHVAAAVVQLSRVYAERNPNVRQASVGGHR